MTTIEKQKPVRVYVSPKEAILQGEPLNGLVDRIAKELDSGAKVVDMHFPSTLEYEKETFSGAWVTLTEFNFSDGSKAKISPIEMVYTELNNRGYNVTSEYGTEVPKGTIRISRR
jgi:hypothetical protein